MNRRTVQILQELRGQFEESNLALSEGDMEESGRAALHWVKRKFGAAKAIAHRAFVKMVRKDPAAHRAKMRSDKKYHARHKWHDALMRKTSRPGWARRHMRAHVEISDETLGLAERDPGQSFMDLPFELRVTSADPQIGQTVGDWDCPKCGFKGRPKPSGKCPKCGAEMVSEEVDPKSMKVQTLIFAKSHFSRSSAKKWAKSHGFKASKVDEKENTFRLRQKPPSKFETFRTITFKPGIKAVVAKG